METKLAKIDDLADTMFKLMEDISNIEDIVEETKRDLDALRENFEDNISKLRASHDIHAQKIADSSEFATRFSKLESSVGKIANSEVLSEISARIDSKAMLKREITRYQRMFVGIVAFLGVGVVAFFAGVFLGAFQGNFIYLLIALIVAIAPFIVAMILINVNLKKLMIEDKLKSQNRFVRPVGFSRIRGDARESSDLGDSSNSRSSSDSRKNRSIDMEIKNTFD